MPKAEWPSNDSRQATLALSNPRANKEEPITVVQLDGTEAELPSETDLAAIKGDKYAYVLGGRSFAAVYKINPTKKPKEMDITFEEGPQKGKTMLAIYSLKGDELKICGADKRPSEVKSEPKSNVILFVFKRDKQ